MKADVKSLKELNAEARQRCVLSEGDSNHMDKNSLYKPFSNQVVGFNIRPEDHECRLLGMAENSLVELARTRQKSHWMSSKKTINVWPNTKNTTTSPDKNQNA